LLINKIIFVFIFAVLLYAAIAILSDFKGFSKDIQNVNFSYLPIIISLIFGSILIKSIRQKVILKKIGIRISLKENFVLYISGLSMMITPGGSGEIIKSHFLKKRHNENISKTLPYTFVERYHDFIGIIIILFITLVLVRSLETEIILAISLSIIVLAYVLAHQKNMLFWIQTKFKKIKLIKNLFSNDNEFYQSLFTLIKPKTTLYLIAITFPTIVLDSFVAYLSFISIFPDENYIHTTQVFFTSILAGLFSFIPGGLGITEINMISLLKTNSVTFSQVATAVLYVRFTSLWFMTILGFIFLKAFVRTNKSNNHLEQN